MKYSIHRNKLIHNNEVSLIIVSLLSLLLFGCDLDKHKQFNSINALKDIPYNTSMELYIPTYDGSNQAVHPDILPLDNPALPGINYALVFTPYPYGNETLENPSLVFSKDGISFYEPFQGSNPLVPPPPYDHNDDPDITYNPGTGYYYLHYLETCRPDSQSVICLMSRDLRSWNRHTAIHYNLIEHQSFILSPSVICNALNDWYLFYVNTSAHPTRIEYLMSNDGLDWNQNTYQVPTQLNKPNIVPWHLDVFQGGDMYYMLISGYETRNFLYIARSNDMQTWEWSSKPIFPTGNGSECNDKIYRSSGLVLDNDLVIYYSYTTPSHTWQIGLIKLDLNQLF